MSAAAFALAVSAVVWQFAAPLWTLNQLRAAAAAGNVAAMTAHVDYPALRASLAAGLRGTASGASDPARGAAELDPLVDALASPAGLRTMLLGAERPLPGPEAPTGNAAGGLRIERTGFSTFRVIGAAAGALVFRRAGYAWKLVGIDPPPGLLAALR